MIDSIKMFSIDKTFFLLHRSLLNQDLSDHHFFRSFDVFCFLLLCFDLFIIWVVFWGVNIIYMDCLTLQYCSKTFKFVIRYSLFVIRVSYK